MSRKPHLRLAVIGALSAALMLAGCGRRGGLDLPPSAKEPQVTAASQADAPFPGAAPVGDQILEPGYGPEGQPVAAPGAKRRLPIDWLLD